MTYLLAKAPVEEFAKWKSAFHRFESFRTENGQRGYQVFRSSDDPDEIVVLFEWEEGKDPREFFQSEAMRERMKEAGVKGKPELSVLEFVERKSTPTPSA